MPGRARRGVRGEDALDLDLGGEDGSGLVALPGVRGARVVQRLERAVNESIRAARADLGAEADPRWRGAETLARVYAGAIDRTIDPYAVAQLGPKLLELLRELRLTPVSIRDSSRLDAALAALQGDDPQ